MVPEGIDLTVTESAKTEPARDLDELIAALPEHRHGLPLAVSVGRLHQVKGMATVKLAGDPSLWARYPGDRAASL